MSKVKIDYSEIRAASKRAKTISGYYEDMVDDIEKRVSKKLRNLEGSDSEGNVSSAQKMLSDKMKSLGTKKDYYLKLSESIATMAKNMEEHEDHVVSGIRTIGTEALDLKEQGRLQSIAQWAYGTFCVDLLNWNPITRGLGNGIKRGLDWVQEKGTEVENWFKHGGGKYVLDIALDTLAVIGAAAATVGAVVLVAGTGGAALPLVIAAGASCLGTALTFGDYAVSAYSKYKACQIYDETGDPGQARYYASIGGVNDAVGKYDVGGKTANNVVGAVGTGYDVLHTAADITAMAAGAAGKAGLSDLRVKEPSGRVTLQTVYDPSKVKGNLVNMFKEELGFRNKAGKWTFDIKNLFTTKDPITGTTARANLLEKNAMVDMMGRTGYKNFETFQKVVGVPGDVHDFIEDIGDVFSPDSSLYDRAKGILGVGGSTNLKISSPISDFNSTVLEIVDTVIDLAS